MKITNEAKNIGEWFREGVHKVIITGVTAAETADGKEFFVFSLAGENGEEGEARLYFTERAMPYSLRTVRGIFVHNTVEQNKDKIREQVDAVGDTNALLKLCQVLPQQKAEAWYKVERSDRTYINANGETKNSYDKNLFHYEPQDTRSTDVTTVDDSEEIDFDKVPFN